MVHKREQQPYRAVWGIESCVIPFHIRMGKKNDSKNAKFTSSLLSQKHVYFILCTAFIPSIPLQEKDSESFILPDLSYWDLVLWKCEQEFSSIIIREKKIRSWIKRSVKKKKNKQNLLSAVDQKTFFVSFIKIFPHCDHQNFEFQWKTSKMGSHLQRKNKKQTKKTNKAYGKHKNKKRTSPSFAFPTEFIFLQWAATSALEGASVKQDVKLTILWPG